MSASSGSGFEWPSVTDADSERPRAVDQGTDEDLILVRPREVVAHGTVNTIPWTIQGYVTGPGPNPRWWLHGPVGPELEFLLGKDGRFGGAVRGSQRARTSRRR